MAEKFRYRLNVGPLDDLVMPTFPTGGATPTRKQVIDRSFSNEAAASEQDPGFLSRVFDVVSRPLYGVSNVVKDTIDQSEGTSNPFESFWAGFSGIDKTTGADILDQVEQSSGGDITFADPVKGSLGLAWDVGADPLNAIPVGKVAKGVAKATEAIGGALTGAKKTGEAIKSGEGITRHTLEDITKRGGKTERMTEGEVMPDAGVAEPSQGRLQDIVYEEGSQFNPRAGGTGGFQPPEFLNEIMGAPAARTESGAFAPEYRPGDPFDPKLMAPSTKLSDTATSIRDTEEKITGPVGRSSDGRVYVQDKNGMVIQVREQAPPKPLELEPARKELPPGNLETKPPRTFEVGMPTEKSWDLSPNDIPQSYLLQDLTKQARADLPQVSDLTIQQKKLTMLNQIQNDLHAAKDTEMAAGRAPVVHLDGENYYFHMADAMDSIPASDFARMHMNAKANIAPSSILKGMMATVKADSLGLKEDNLYAFIRDAMVKADARTTRRASESELKRAINVFIGNKSKIQWHLIANEKKIAKSDYMAGKAIGNAVVKDITDTLSNPRVSNSKELVRVADLYGDINRKVRAAGLLPGEAMAATQTAREALGGAIDDLDVAAARDTLAMAKMAQRGDGEALRARALKLWVRDSAAAAKVSEQNAHDFALELARSQSAGKIMSAHPSTYADLLDREMDDYLNGFNRYMRTWQTRMVAGGRQGKLFGVRRQQQATSGMLNTQFRDDINKLVKDVGEEQFNATFSHIWRGLDPGKLSAADQKVFDQLYPIMKGIVDPAGGFVDNAIFRVGVESDAFDAMAKARGLPWLEMTKLAKYDGEPLAQIWLREAKGLEIKNPRDFLFKFHAMATDASTFAATARSMESLARTSTAPGFSKIAQTGTFEENPLSRFLNLDMHYPDEIIEQARVMQKEILKPVNWGKSDTPLAKFMNKVFDPILRIWKTAATLLRPGHHLANMMGDTSSNFMVGVKPHDYYIANEALRAMGLVGRQSYEALERALHTGLRTADYKAPGAMGHAFDVTLKDGTKIPHTYGQAGEKIFRHGGLSDFRTLEDTELAGQGMFGTDDTVKSPINKFTDRLINSRYGRVMERWSEWNSNTQRASQVFNRMRDPKFTKQFGTEDEAWQEAVAESLRTHPDSAGLASFEKKYGRRLIPFYSWNRQILPWVMTNFLVNTRRTMYIPKIQYNAQIAMGQDPESLSFPYTNSAGLPMWALGMLGGNIMGDPNQPQGFNVGYSLSTPLDTLSDWTNMAGVGGNPLPAFGKQLVQSLNPAATLPFDLSNPAKDKSEEIDERIPGASTFKSMTGYSPAGTIGNVATGNLQVDPTRQLLKGQRMSMLNEATFNFLTGLKVQDFSDYSGFNKPTVRTSGR